MCEKIELKDNFNKKLVFKMKIRKTNVKKLRPKNPKMPGETLLEEIIKGSTIEERSLFIAINKGNHEEAKRILESMEKTTKGKMLRAMQEKLLRIIVENRFARKQIEFLNMERAAQILSRERAHETEFVGNLLRSNNKNVRVGALIGLFEAVERKGELDLALLDIIGISAVERAVIQNYRTITQPLREKIKLDIVHRVAQGIKINKERAANDTEAEN
jgi:hypothetical protein